MIERYLEPLKQESFLSQDDIDGLFGNIQEILVFQKIFLKSLEQSIETDILTYNITNQFRVSFLFSFFLIVFK
jgi:T-lymphoma invasion and metastasis-inducing protein 1